MNDKIDFETRQKVEQLIDEISEKGEDYLRDVLYSYEALIEKGKYALQENCTLRNLLDKAAGEIEDLVRGDA